MASIRARSKTFFFVGPVEDGKARCFAVTRGLIQDRFDAVFYGSSSRIARSKYPLSEVGAHFFVRDGDHNRLPDEEITTGEVGIRYLRAQDLREGEITSTTPIFVTKRYFSTVVRSHIRPGDLLFSIMASIGNSAIVPINFPKATANRAVGILAPKRDDPTLTWFLFYLFSTDLGGELYTRIKKGGLQQRTNLSDVEVLEFPLPPDSVRRDLVSAINTARSERMSKVAAANDLLDGFDDYLLTALGLTALPKDGRKVFAVSHADALARLDPHYHLPSLAHNTRVLNSNGARALGTLVSFSDETWDPPKHDEETFRYIEISNVNPNSGEAHAQEVSVVEAPSRARMQVRTNDIIVSLTRPHHGSIAQITPELNGCIASTGFSVLRGVDTNQMDREYLWCILRSKMCLLQMLQRASGGNYPAITEPELAKILLPVPKPAVQQAIAAEGRRRREEVSRLRSEAEVGWQAAKQWFENQLLKGGE
jgi:type I restriction enzyme S subunit